MNCSVVDLYQDRSLLDGDNHEVALAVVAVAADDAVLVLVAGWVSAGRRLQE
jgi:hypothetical protein